MDDPPPDDLAARRAERARRNGRHSRGPVSERGKARSSRNALRHGLTAKVHLVLDRDDEAEFRALAAGLDDELAPRGTLEAFLVARLTAAMWHTGRAERMEARAFAAADPDPDRLRLALRYRGSVQRELFRCLRALQELRCRPLALGNRDHDDTAEPERHAAEPSPDAIDPIRLAIAAWGGERAGPIPPGFLELRPVPQVWPIAWRFVQDRAFPGDVPLLVYADGTVRSPEGELLEDVWSPEAPPSPLPEPAAPPAMPTAATTIPAPAVEATSALNWHDDENGDRDFDHLLPTPRQRNEPTQPVAITQFPGAPNLLGTGSEASRIGLGRTAPELEPVPDCPGRWPIPQPPPQLADDRSPLCDSSDAGLSGPPERDPSHSPHLGAWERQSPRLGAWERMWGITLPEPEPVACTDDTSEPSTADSDERNCTIEFNPCTPEPEQAVACVGSRHESAGTSPGQSDIAAAPRRGDPLVSPETREGSGGRLGRLRRRNPRLTRRRCGSRSEDGP